MSAMKVELAIGVAGASRVVLDGQDVSKAVSAFDLHADVKSIPTLYLHLPLLDIDPVSGVMQVNVDETSHEMLVGLGWTPPAVQHADAPAASA